MLNDSGQTAFRGGLTGSGVDDNNNSGIWSEGSGSLALVAREGDIAPETTRTFRDFLIPFDDLILNDSGQTVFSGSVPDINIPAAGNSGIWSEVGGSLALVALAEESAPGTTEFFLSGFDFTQNNSGHVAFRAGLAGGPITAPDKGIWTNRSGSVNPVILDKELAPGTGSPFFILDAPVIDDVGNTAFYGGTSTGRRGIWAERDKVLEAVALEGDTAPGTAASFRDFRVFPGDGTPARNSAGDITFFATLTGVEIDSTNDTGIWAAHSGSIELVAHAGENAPGTSASFTDLDRSAPVINSEGDTAFIGRLSGAGLDNFNNRGIWSENSGSLGLVARNGDAAPGTTANFWSFFDLSFNGSGQTAFRATVTGTGVDGTNSVGIWAENSAGDLVLIARRGDLLDVDDGPGTDFRTILDIAFVGETGNEDGRASGFNEFGQLAFSASFTDGTEGIFVSDIATIPEPISSSLFTLALGIICLRNRWLIRHHH